MVLKQKSRVQITRIKHDFDLSCLLQNLEQSSSCSKNITHFDSEHGFHFKKFPPPLPSDKNSRPQRRRFAARNVWLARRGAVLLPGKDKHPKLDHFSPREKHVQKENSKKRPKNKSSDIYHIYNSNPTTSPLYDKYSYHNYQWYEPQLGGLALSTVKTTSGTFGGGDFAPAKIHIQTKWVSSMSHGIRHR